MKRILIGISALLLVGCSGNKTDSKKAISDFLYQDQIAWSTSESSGWEFRLNHAYPGSVDEAEARICIVMSTGSYPYGVADMATLREDPEWLPPKTTKDGIAFTSPPKGDTYIVTVNDDGDLAQVHFTILDGKTYYYPSFCDE